MIVRRRTSRRTAIGETPVINGTERHIDFIGIATIVGCPTAVNHVGRTMFDKVVEGGDGQPGGDTDKESRAENIFLIVKDIVKHGQGRVVTTFHAHHAEETEHSKELRRHQVGIAQEEGIDIKGYRGSQIDNAVKGGQVTEASPKPLEQIRFQISEIDAQQVIHCKDKDRDNFQNRCRSQIEKGESIAVVISKPKGIANITTHTTVALGPSSVIVLFDKERTEYKGKDVKEDEENGKDLINGSTWGLGFQKGVDTVSPSCRSWGSSSATEQRCGFRWCHCLSVTSKY
mmetsp:Transcript_17847/g.29529  ORF Transcript_17847/g.29529 Transcript_17847/m.29529 type:complete len:287 (-) Transcript_17847:65-925(-)